jgi:hypothetical protein
MYFPCNYRIIHHDTQHRGHLRLESTGRLATIKLYVLIHHDIPDLASFEDYERMKMIFAGRFGFRSSIPLRSSLKSKNYYCTDYISRSGRITTSGVDCTRGPLLN